MTRLLLTLALLLWATTAQAQVSFPQVAWSANANAFETDATEAVSFGGTVSTGCRVYVGIGATATNRTISSVTDDGGNTYALASQGGTDATVESGTSATEMWIYTAPVTTTMQTATVVISSALATPARVALWAVCGQDATTPTEDVAVATQAGATSHACGGLVTAAAGSGLVGMIGGSNGTYNNEAGWTSNGSVTNYHAAYRTIDAATTTWTPTTSASEATTSVCLAIAPAAVAGGCTGGLTLLGAGKCE